jgi:predicted nucleic acid-binding protein
MTLFLDTSALLKRYVDEPGTADVVHAMAVDLQWAASAVARTETELSLCKLVPEPELRAEIVASFVADWARFHVIAVDPECLTRAIEIGCEHGVRTLDALHLAAAERLPAPLTFWTFDSRQQVAATAMGIAIGGTRGSGADPELPA